MREIFILAIAATAAALLYNAITWIFFRKRVKGMVSYLDYQITQTLSGKHHYTTVIFDDGRKIVFNGLYFELMTGRENRIIYNSLTRKIYHIVN
jgi:hypothetical protein